MKLNGIIKLKLPGRLNSEIKDLIETSYRDASEEMGDEEFDYICKKIDNKLKITQCAATSWISKLSMYYSILFKIFNHDLNISSNAFGSIGAALFYFINPFDIIPDYTVGIGYLDDFFVLILCLKSLRKNDKKIVNEYFDR